MVSLVSAMEPDLIRCSGSGLLEEYIVNYLWRIQRIDVKHGLTAQHDGNQHNFNVNAREL
jgi:hypothetical protein